MSGSYTSQVDAGNKPSYTVTGLQDGKKYYFAAKAYNSGKTVWSGFSNEVSATIGVSPPPTACPCSLWGDATTPAIVSANDANAVELGMKFRSDVAGYITALRFYKGSGNTGRHVGNLWTSTGTLLASVSYTNETASGWQRINLPAPVAVTAGTTYVASYHTTVGRYSANSAYFTGEYAKSPLRAPASGASGGNGVYKYAASGFPNQTYNASNYWVDVVFSTTASPPAASIAGFNANPTAGFNVNPTSGTAPLTVTFTDTSTGNITSRSWNFGDGTMSSATTAAKNYPNSGTYTVTLTVMGPAGSNTTSKTILATAAAPVATQSAYITVSSTTSGGGNNAGLVGAYNFEEASGSTVVDASGKGNTGTISGATRITQGRFGKALSFDGVNDWVTINDSASLDLTTDMTLEAWVYPTGNMTDWSTALVKENPSHGFAYGLYANSDTSRPAGSTYIGGDKNLLGGPWLLTNTWVHLATTYNGSIQRLYVNGTEVASRAQSGSIEVSNGALRIGGNRFWGEFFQGRIDDVRVYNRALSATQVSTDMNSPPS